MAKAKAKRKSYNTAAALGYLNAQLGKPYRWAAAGPNAFDCSGLTMRAFAVAGYRMPHNSMAQYVQTSRFEIKATNAPPAGALVFFGHGGVITHVGASIGGGLGIFAPHTGANVEKESIAAVRSSFTTYHVTNPLGVTDDLTQGEYNAAARANHGHVPALLGLFLSAIRWQESGSPKGNYLEPNGQGAYQIIPSTWQALTKRFQIGTQYSTASAAPPAIQDEVAAEYATMIFYGAGEKSWRLTARVWNGGTPNVVPNPALGEGATTDTYASQVLAKMRKINPTQDIAASADSSATADDTGGCVHLLSIDLKITSGHICMDKPLAIVAMWGGGVIVLAGITVLMVGALKGTAAGKAAGKAAATAATALPVGRVAKIATAGTAANRTARAQTKAAAEAKRTAPIATASRQAAAETRREQAHSTRQSAASAAEARRRTAHRRAGTAAAQRRRQSAEAHSQRMNTRSIAAFQRSKGRSEPGLGHEPLTRTRHRVTVPDEPPF